MSKVRHIDYYPDEFIAGIVGTLTDQEVGYYWLICTLIYSRGGPIADDAAWLAGMMRKGHHRTARAVVDRLVAMGKVIRLDGENGPMLAVKRCDSELNKTLNRVGKARDNGANGGRPRKKNNDIAKPDGFSGEKLTTNQPTNRDSSLRSESHGGGGVSRARARAADKPTARPGTDPDNNRPTEADDDQAQAIVDHFERLRAELWPEESGLPAPRLTLTAQARQYLATGAPLPLLIEVIDRGMRKAADQGKTATVSLKAFHRSVADAAASHRASLDGEHHHAPATQPRRDRHGRGEGKRDQWGRKAAALAGATRAFGD